MTNTSWFGAPSLGVASVDGFVNSASLENRPLFNYWGEVSDFLDEYKEAGLLTDSNVKVVNDGVGTVTLFSESVAIDYLRWCFREGKEGFSFNDKVDIADLVEWVEEYLQIDEAEYDADVFITNREIERAEQMARSLLTIGYFEVDVIDGFVKFSDAYAKIGRAVPFYVQDFVDEYRASGLLAESDLKFVPGTIGSELWAAKSVIVAYLEWARCMTSGISSVNFNNINIDLLADWVNDLLESLDEDGEQTNDANLPDYSPEMTLAEIWDLQ